MKKLRFQFDAMTVSLMFLAAHLLSINIRLFYHLNPDAVLLAGDKLAPFNWLNFTDQNLITAFVFAVPYSIITVVAIKMLNLKSRFQIVQFLPVLYLAVLDGAGTMLYYTIKRGQEGWETFFQAGAIYYAVYTFTIVALIGIQKVWGVKFDELEISGDEKWIHDDIERFIAATKNFKDADKGQPLQKPVDKGEIEPEISVEDKGKEFHKTIDTATDIMNKKDPEVAPESIKEVLDKLIPDALEENIIYLFNTKKFIQKEIAAILNTSEAKVTRTLRKAGLKD